MTRLLFIVSRTKPGTYTYLKLVNESGDIEVVFDRREVDRRQIQRRMTPERRSGDRRRRNITTDLAKSGWALVHRYTTVRVEAQAIAAPSEASR